MSTKSLHTKRYQIVAGILNPKSHDTRHDLYPIARLPNETRLETAERVVDYFDKQNQIGSEFRENDRAEQILNFYRNKQLKAVQEYDRSYSPITYKWKNPSLAQLTWLMERKRRVYLEGQISQEVFRRELAQLAVLRKQKILLGRK